MHQDSLLVLAPSPGIGDFIVRIPAVRLLASHFHVTLICPLPENMRGFTEKCLAEKQVELVLAGGRYRKNKIGVLLGHWEDLLFASNHRRHATACVLMSDSNSDFGIAKYALISFLSSQATRRFALRPASGKFPFHENITVPGGLQKMARYFEFAKSVMAALDQPWTGSWDAGLPELRHLPLLPYIVLAPGGKYRRQCWPYFDRLSKWLQEQNVRTVIVGSADERALIDLVRQPGQEVLIGADLLEVARIMEQATAVVCNDSGLLHLAVWQGVRVVAICGPRFAASWTGYPECRVVQLYEGRAANPDEGEDTEYRASCLANISSDRVIAEVNRILG